MKRAALYVRVSTQEQKKHGLSVDNQIEALREYCTQHNLEPYKIYNDAGHSGHASYKTRSALLRLIQDCQAGKIDVILFTRIDRWFRSIKDYYLVMEQLNGVPWRAIWEDYNTETSDGQFKVNIMLSISEAEAARTSEKIKSVFEYKRAKGHYIGRVPFGYCRKDGYLVKDTNTQAMIELLFDTYMRTWSVRRTCDILYAEGYPLPSMTVRRMLKKELYAGFATNDGTSSCEPYITIDQHKAILDSFDKRIRTSNNRVYIFTGLVICAYCGHRMTSHAIVSGKSQKVSLYYRCTGKDLATRHDKHLHISELKLERQLLDKFDDIIKQRNSISVDVKKKEQNHNVIKTCEDRLKRIGIRFELGDISVDEYKAKRADLLAQIESAKRSMTDTVEYELPDDWRDIYAQLTRENKRAFWREFISEIVISNENKNSISFDDIVFRD